MNKIESTVARFIKRAVLVSVLAWALPSAQAAFNASLQGQSFGSAVWQSVNLTGWKELDFIPCRVFFTNGPASNQTIVVEFDHTKTSGSSTNPGIQNLFYFSNSPNVTITSGPTLSAPAGVDTWSYAFGVNFTSATEGGFVEFRARLAAGAHNFTGSSLGLKGSLNGSPSPGVLQIAKPGPGGGDPDLAVTKSGPALANPGATITYTLVYTNKAGSATTGAQLTDALPGLVTLANCSGGCYLVGNTLTWDLGGIARGAGGSVTYSVIVTNFALNGQTFRNSVTLLSADNDQNYNDNYASVTTMITNGCIPPLITSNPVGTTNCAGSPATLSVVASGSSPHYQWRKGGSSIAGASGSAYTINASTVADSGGYDVVVTNLCGSVTSSLATLLVQPLTSLNGLTDQVVCPGQSVTLSITAVGTGPFSYQWVKDGAPLAGGTNSSLTLSAINAADAGIYSVNVNGLCNSATNSATLTVNMPTTADPPVAQTKCPGDTVSFSTTAHGTGPFSYQWSKDGTPISGQTDSSLTIANLAAGHAGTYAVEVTGACNSTTQSATLTVNTPTTADSPVAQTKCSGDTVSFSTSAHGTGPFSYQWAKDGAPMSGQTDSSLTLANLAAGDAGTYSVQVTGVCNSTTNSATLTVNMPTTADSPVAQTKCPGDTVSFSTTAHGTGPFSYQWAKDGAPMSGQTDSLLTVSGITADSAGNYSVQVTGVCNSATKSAALTVNTPTTADPLLSQTNCPGTAASFGVTAHGTGPFSYQWAKDGAPLFGQTDSSLTLTNLAAGDAGTYAVEVTGACNSATNFTTLSVNTPTTADPLLSQTHCAGTTASFSTTAHGTGPFSYQWVKDGTPMSGQTDSTLTLSGITADSAGIYSVQVTGACNRTTQSASLTVNTPTTTDPLPSQTNCAGTTASFSTTAQGTGPFSYQWAKDGAPMSGQTDSTLTLSGITADSAGIYSVEVNGVCNSTTNSASLTVNTPTTADPLLSQTNCAGTTASFSTTAHGTGPFSYQWAKDGTPMSGQTDSSLTLASITAASAGTYSVEVAGTCNSATQSASLTVNTPTTADPLLSQTNCPGTTASFSTTAHGTGPFSYQWAKDGTPMSGQTGSSLTLTNLAAGDAGTYAIEVTGACNSATNFTTLSVNTPTTADALLSQTNCPGTTASFSTTAHGTGPFSYQWAKDGTPLSGQTGSSLTLTNLAAGDAGTYAVEVTGACNSATNFTTLSVNTPTTAEPLLSQTNCAGTTASFSAIAHGTGPFSYLWRKDGKVVLGGTQSSLLLSNVSVLDADTYTVVVSGLCNSVTNSATLTINAPTTATPMANQTLCFGRTATFSTTPRGAGPFSFVWRKDGLLLADQTGNSITINKVKATDAGTYTVEVAGLCNRVTNSATLAVESDGPASPATFANPGVITINDFSPAAPYPSAIEVSCVPGPVSSLTVTITNLSHTYVSDIHILLVGPTGQAVMLMADAGDANAITDAIIGFSDGAPNLLPEEAPIVTGVYKPTNYAPTENMPAPAPPGPYGSALSSFIGSDANGTWSLYVVDDNQGDTGTITGGWSLTLGWEVAVPRAQLCDPTMLSDGCSKATLQGQSGKTYVVEASTDLFTWTPILTNTMIGTNWSFVDVNSTNYSRRFYRAVYSP